MDIHKKKVTGLILAISLQFCVTFGVIQFQQNIMTGFSMPVRAILVIVLQWILLIVPIIFMKCYKISLSDIGFNKSKLNAQIFTGMILGIGMSLVFTVLPILIGFKDIVGSTSYTQVWQFFHQFVYMILGVAFAEEFFYRGFLFQWLTDLRCSKRFVIMISSIIFGISHIFTGNILQIIMTSILGVFLCICRDKIKHCTILSLIIAHGLHNALITLFVAILP